MMKTVPSAAFVVFFVVKTYKVSYNVMVIVPNYNIDTYTCVLWFR